MTSNEIATAIHYANVMNNWAVCCYSQHGHAVYFEIWKWEILLNYLNKNPWNDIVFLESIGNKYHSTEAIMKLSRYFDFHWTIARASKHQQQNKTQQIPLESNSNLKTPRKLFNRFYIAFPIQQKASRVGLFMCKCGIFIYVLWLDLMVVESGN